MSQRLMPGNYFIEMAFRRPVTEETLTNALKGMGFANIEFDKSDDSVVGGISITSPTLSRLGGAVNLKSKAVAVPVATSITRALAPSSITPVAAPMTRALASPITRQTSSRS